MGNFNIFKKRTYLKNALSFSGWCIGSFPSYIQLYGKTEEDTEVDWIQGCSGIAYPRKVLNKTEIIEFMSTLPEFMVKHDDHIISGYLEHKKIRKIALKEDFKNIL